MLAWNASPPSSPHSRKRPLTSPLHNILRPHPQNTPQDASGLSPIRWYRSIGLDLCNQSLLRLPPNPRIGEAPDHVLLHGRSCPMLVPVARMQRTTFLMAGSMADYLHEFESLEKPIVDVPFSFLLECFISRLKPDIQREVLSLQPHSLTKAIELAKLHEDKHTEIRNPPRSRPKFTQISTHSQPTKQPPSLPTPNSFPIIPLK